MKKYVYEEVLEQGKRKEAFRNMKLKTTLKKRNWKKILLIALGIVLIAVILLNALWFAWSRITYGRYTADLNMDKTEWHSFLVPRYWKQDGDGFDFSVKYPDYLSTTGNLCVGCPSETAGDFFTDSLIIWPKAFGGYDYGLILYEEDTQYQIYVDSSGKPLDSAYDEVVERHRENADLLFAKAENLWQLIQ